MKPMNTVSENERPWYAAMRDREDNDWGYGSYDIVEAKTLLRNFDSSEAYIAVIVNGCCVEEIEKE